MIEVQGEVVRKQLVEGEVTDADDDGGRQERNDAYFEALASAFSR